MRFWGFLLVSILFATCDSAVWAAEPAFFKLRASELSRGYAIKLLKPIPRHNNGCSTVFRNGKALETCDGNFGLNPAQYGGILTFCRWDLNTVYTGDDSKEWAEPLFIDHEVLVSESINAWTVKNDRDTIYGRIRGIENIKDRRLTLRFQNSDLGQLTCYAGYLKSYRKNSDYYYGATSFKWNKTQEDEVYSGLSIGDVQKQLASFIEIVTVQ